jgi:hypothetical protein
MYTKHKTQKRKVWQDGFVALYDTRRIVLFEEPPPEGWRPLRWTAGCGFQVLTNQLSLA